MARLVSVLGPDVSLDVYFLKSVFEYEDALKEKRKLDEALRSTKATTVIYRQAYNPVDNKLYATRQTDPSQDGNERFSAAEPTNATVAGYDLFSAPESLLGGAERALTASVERILAYSHGSVGSAGTHR